MENVNGVVLARTWTGLVAVIAAGITMTLAAGCSIRVEGPDNASASEIEGVTAIGNPRFDELSAEGQLLIKDALVEGPRHTEVAIGMEIDAGGMSIGASPDEPMLTSDVDAQGDAHTVFDMNSTLQQFAGGTVDFPDARIEQWSDGEWMYFDTTAFDPSLAGELGADDGDLMEPGVFKIDLDRVEQETEMSAEAITGASTGQDMDITPYLYALADNVGGAVTDPDDPSKQRVETTLGELMQYAEDDSGMMFDDLTDPAVANDEQMVEAFEQVPVIFVFSTDDEDRLKDLSVDIDMSTMFSSMAEGLTPMATLPNSGDESLDALFDELTATLTMKFSMLIEIDYDGVEDITMPDGVDDDRTEAFIEALTSG